MNYLRVVEKNMHKLITRFLLGTFVKLDMTPESPYPSRFFARSQVRKST
jgi:hypothetical protein